MLTVVGNTTVDVIVRGLSRLPQLLSGDGVLDTSLVETQERIAPTLGGNGASAAYVAAGLGELVRLWEQTGKTVIYVTHSIEEALLMGDRTVIMTAQPGRIKQIIDVPFPHPRDLLQLASSAEFGKLKLDIWRVLEEEVNRARAEMEK